MFRKVVAMSLALVLTVGVLFAEEIQGVFKKFEDGKLTITVDEKEKTFKIPEDLTVKIKGKDGEEKEFKVSAMLEKAKEGRKLTVTVDGDKVTAVKMARGGKGKDKGKDKQD
jgi:hypothetical protein